MKKILTSFPRLWTVSALVPYIHLLNRDLFHWSIVFLVLGALLRRQRATGILLLGLFIQGSVLCPDNLLISEFSFCTENDMQINWKWFKEMCMHCAGTHNPSDYVYLMICWFSSLQVSEGNERNTHVQKRYSGIWRLYSARGSLLTFLNMTLSYNYGE